MNDFMLEASPEASEKSDAFPALSPKYVFAVGRYNPDADRFIQIGRVTMLADSGAVEIECGHSSYPWEPFCSKLGKAGFNPVPFVPSVKPGDDAACRAVAERLRSTR